MTITILTGLPGSGKSERLIKTVRAALGRGQTALTLCCSDSPILAARPGIAEHRRLSSRSGLSTQLDHFVSAPEGVKLLDEAPAGALLAFDEAQHFGDALLEAWHDASERSVEVLIASPSPSQLKALQSRGHEATRLTLTCQACNSREASTFLCYLDDDRTQSLCEACHRQLKKEAEAEIVDRLRRQDPHAGEEKTYQPVELEACRNWYAIRTDSQRRYQLVRDACASQGLPSANSSYLDVGCNTGFFCYHMSRAGFRATGVDVVRKDIEVARLLSTFFRRDYATYVVSDALEFLSSPKGEMYDVTSAFSVFQWVMIQKTPEHGLDCMRWLFRRTRYVCVLELGESTEQHYIDRIGMKYDRAWIQNFMQENGGFGHIDVVDGHDHKLLRDVFIGFKK